MNVLRSVNGSASEKYDVACISADSSTIRYIIVSQILNFHFFFSAPRP